MTTLKPPTLTLAQRAEATVALPDDVRADAAAALDPTLRIERARDGLSAKLDELRRREQRSPMRSHPCVATSRTHGSASGSRRSSVPPSRRVATED